MANIKGNKDATILKEPEARQLAFKDFCKHLAEGYPIKAWSFRKEPYRCSWATMLQYIKDNPKEFDSFLKEEAHAKSYKKWFNKGINLSDGTVKGNPSPQTWATIMRNMFDWDKDEKNTNQQNKQYVQSLAESLRDPEPETKTSDQTIQQEN